MSGMRNGKIIAASAALAIIAAASDCGQCSDGRAQCSADRTGAARAALMSAVARGNEQMRRWYA